MKDKIFTHLTNLVSYYPVTKDQKAVLKTLQYCQEVLLNAHKFEDLKIYKKNGVHSLYASTQATKRPKILLNGHIDVVPAPLSQRKLTSKNNRYYGRGVYDDLFATAIFLSVVEELKSNLGELDLAVMFSGDEELGGFNGTKYLAEQGIRPQLCIMPDAGEGFGDLNTGCRGIYNFDLEVKGASHHGSRPWDGDGAANKLIALLNELLNLTTNKPNAPFTVVTTMLNAGDSINKAPAAASAHIDIRYEQQSDLAIIKHELKRLLIKYEGSIQEISTGAAFKLDLENQLVKEFLRLYKDAAGNVTYSKTTGSSDARFLAAQNIPVIMLRPLGGDLHGDNEWVDITEIQKVQNLIKQYLQEVGVV